MIVFQGPASVRYCSSQMPNFCNVQCLRLCSSYIWYRRNLQTISQLADPWFLKCLMFLTQLLHGLDDISFVQLQRLADSVWRTPNFCNVYCSGLTSSKQHSNNFTYLRCSGFSQVNMNTFPGLRISLKIKYKFAILPYLLSHTIFYIIFQL